MTRPRKERGGLPTALNAAKLPTPYRFSLFPQVFSGRRAATRRGVSCDSRGTNSSLGGFGGRYALSRLFGVCGARTFHASSCSILEKASNE